MTRRKIIAFVRMNIAFGESLNDDRLENLEFGRVKGCSHFISEQGGILALVSSPFEHDKLLR